MVMVLKTNIGRREADQSHILCDQLVSKTQCLQSGRQAVRGEEPLDVDDGRRRQQTEGVDSL